MTPCSSNLSYDLIHAAWGRIQYNLFLMGPPASLGNDVYNFRIWIEDCAGNRLYSPEKYVDLQKP